VQHLEVELQHARETLHDKTSIVKKPKRKRHTKTDRSVVSLSGGYRCAMKRNMGHAGAESLLAHIDATVVRPNPRLARNGTL
jgi:hypothetical protein